MTQIATLDYSLLSREDASNKNILSINRQCGAGLFSNFTTLLWDIIECRSKELRVDQLSAGIGMECYKDQEDDDPIAELLRKPALGRNFFDLPIIEKPDYHGNYSEINIVSILPYLDYFFKPSPRVLQRLNDLIIKHNLWIAEVDCICYRGTDKWTELPRIDPESFCENYYKACERFVLDARPILIQTDELKIRNHFLNVYRDIAFYLDEMPVVNGGLAVHLYKFENRLDFAILLFAVNLLISKTRLLVTHTGNMAFWQVLLRGNHKKLIQL